MPARRPWQPHSSVLPCLLLCLAAAARAEVLLVYSIQRHGARNVLPKTDTLKESDAMGGPTLLPEGQRQAWEAGAAYRTRYLSSGAACTGTGTACLETGTTNPGYGMVGRDAFHNFNLLARSSALDRTIATARSFLDATFPPTRNAAKDAYLPDGQQVVPIYSLPEDGAGGPLIRAYTKCPAYDARLLAWYTSPEFRAKEAETVAFRNGIASLAPGLDTSLMNWWNVYDAFNVYRSFNVGTPVPPLENATFVEMQQLANWLETAKMRSELTGNLLSGALLADLLYYLEAAVAAVQSNSLPSVFYKLLHISSHYNTQLGVLGALGLDHTPLAANITWLKKIPSLAALMAFELHADLARNPPEFAVKLVAQDGPDASYSTIPLPCASPAAEALAGLGSCALDAFAALVQPLTFNSTEAWCDACSNTDSVAACRVQALSRQLLVAEGTTTTGGSCSSSGVSGGATAGIAVGCIVVAVAACGLAFAAYRRRMQREMERAKVGQAYRAGALPEMA